jgi:hypothetical protein
MRRSHWLAVLCLVAFALSCGYVAYYLRGGPRIIDATSYFLEARSLAAGSFTFHASDPTAAFRGRFLLASPDGHRLGVIFPPGFPLVLSLGVRLGVPLLVGPLLGALLVAATYALARALGQTTRVAMLAAALSVLCAALRYHTADTMSHGLSALLMCAALTLALSRGSGLRAFGAGLCLGLLVATRPISGVVALLLAGYALTRENRRAWPILLLGLLPGVALLLFQQHALTGSFLGSTQLAYYAASDAPTGCFRYGFGAGIGCRFEHGDYVSRFLPNGYGLGSAVRNLVVHLWVFATDATNAVPLTLLAGFALARHARSPLAMLGVGILLQALAYVPFYFDGNYPGGGARFLCEAIPFCQILVARAACDLRVAWLAPPVAIAGFALYARHGHEELRDREGGQPLFEPAVVARAGVARGLLLVDTDHAFNLGHDPRAEDPRTSLVVARARDDAHDRELYERLGRPPTYRYFYDFRRRSPPHVLPYVPPESRRLEAEAEWPAPLERGHAYPLHYPCASHGKALRLLLGTRASLPVSWVAGASDIDLGWLGTTTAGAHLRAGWAGTRLSDLSAKGPGCTTLHIPGPPPSPNASLIVELVTGEGALDFIQLVEQPGAARR